MNELQGSLARLLARLSAASDLDNVEHVVKGEVLAALRAGINETLRACSLELQPIDNQDGESRVHGRGPVDPQILNNVHRLEVRHQD